MDSQIKRVVVECTKGSDDGSLSFPQVVAKLAQAGVERYHADLVRAEKTYYMPNGDSHVVADAPIPDAPAAAFAAHGVAEAVHAIQAQRIDYPAFCEGIAAAGCVGYFVSLAGRRAIYYGRTGDSYVEPFPGAA